METQLKCMISGMSYDHKPKGPEMAMVRTSFHEAEVTPQVFCDMVSAGHAFMPGVTSGGWRASNWTSQQLLAIDVDNKDGVLLKDDAVQRALRNGLEPMCTYDTYSSTDETPRYRMVFLLPERLTDWSAAKDLTSRLLSLYPEADHACSDAARMFLGSNKRARLISLEPIRVDKLLAIPCSSEIAQGAKPKRRHEGHRAADRRPAAGFAPRFARGLDKWEIEEIKANYGLKDVATGMTDRAPRQSGETLIFPGRCPVCGHNDCFRYYADGDRWHCFSSSNHTGITGGDAIEFVKATHNLYGQPGAFREALALMANGR